MTVREEQTTTRESANYPKLIHLGLLATYWEEKILFVVVIWKEHKVEEVVSISVQSILSEFSDVCSTEIPIELPPLHDIQQRIDFTPDSSLQNLSYYKLNPKEQQILKDIVEDLLHKQVIQLSLSPCAVLTLLVHKKDKSRA